MYDIVGRIHNEKLFKEHYEEIKSKDRQGKNFAEFYNLSNDLHNLTINCPRGKLIPLRQLFEDPKPVKTGDAKLRG